MGVRRPTVGYPSARSFEYEGPGFVCVRVAPLCFCNVAAVFSKLFGFRSILSLSVPLKLAQSTVALVIRASRHFFL
jgi:hypothetical protein